MIRPVLTEVLLFLTPFVIYAAFLLVTRNGVLKPDSWRPRVLVWLTASALILMLGSFVVLSQHESHPPGAKYVPPHVKDGKVIPGQFK